MWTQGDQQFFFPHQVNSYKSHTHMGIITMRVLKTLYDNAISDKKKNL